MIPTTHRTSACSNPKIPAELFREAANKAGYRGPISTHPNMLNEASPHTKTVGTGGYGVDGNSVTESKTEFSIPAVSPKAAKYREGRPR
jgi:hypothetical protein